MTTNRVMDYDTGEALHGEASDALAAASLDEGATGAVPAYRDAAGVWQYVQPSMVAQVERTEQVEVLTVWVEVTP